MPETDDILNMDFGDLMDVGPDPIVPKSPEEEIDKEKPAAETVGLSVNEILEAEQPKDKPVEDVKPDIKDDTPGSSKRTETPSSDPFALVYAKFLLESGSISSFDEEGLRAVIEEDGEAIAMQQLIQGELETAKGELIGKLDAYQKEYSELRGLGVDPNVATGVVASLEEVDKITDEDVANEDNETLRKSVLTAYYKETTQFSEARIQKLVDRSFELGDDVTESKEALDGLKEVRKQRLEKIKQEQTTAVENRETARQASLKSLKDQVDNLTEIIPGQKINKQTKVKIEDMLTKPAKQTEDGQVLNGVWAKRAEDVLDFDIKLAYLINQGAFDGKMATLTKKVKTSAITELEHQISQKGHFTGTGRTPEVDKETKDMIGSMKHLFK